MSVMELVVFPCYLFMHYEIVKNKLYKYLCK